MKIKSSAMMFGRIRRAVFSPVGLMAGLTLALSACAKNAPQDTLEPAGPLARTIDNLFIPVFWIAVVVFFLVQGVILFAMIKFRRRSDDDELPSQTHGNTLLEVGWTALPAVILLVVGVLTLPVIFELNEKPAKALQVKVVAQKYWWAYEYPQASEEFPNQGSFGLDGAKPIVTANELHVPAGQRVLLTLTSTDVIHSFWAPRLNGKRDVVPGRTHTWMIEADEPGVYAGQCAEFCGTSHANMRLKVVAHDPDAWQDWLDGQIPDAKKPPSGLAADGYELFGQQCAMCHKVEGSYDQVQATSPSAPNLTHLFSRDCFAGCLYDLNDRNELKAWLRNPQRKAGSLMVIPKLSEDDINKLVAYLETLD
ncbi:MAG: cytochrome c oxidase subunit II [Acidimicrobiales bacterium]